MICNSNCNSSTVAYESIRPGEITELVRGTDQLILERFLPLVRQQSLVLDLGSVKRIDAAGLAALITLYAEACKAGHTLTVSNLTRHVREILALVGLDRLLESSDSGKVPFFTGQLQQSAA
jgi:anti-anti-sigma factor